MILKFTKTIEIGCCILSLGWVEGPDPLSRWRRGSICTELLMTKGKLRGIHDLYMQVCCNGSDCGR